VFFSVSRHLFVDDKDADLVSDGFPFGDEDVFAGGELVKEVFSLADECSVVVPCGGFIPSSYFEGYALIFEGHGAVYTKYGVTGGENDGKGGVCGFDIVNCCPFLIEVGYGDFSFFVVPVAAERGGVVGGEYFIEGG